MPEYTVKQAIRAFERIWAPISIGMNEMAEADAYFDGGEYSGPAHEQFYMEEMGKTMDRIGSRFGFAEDDLWDELQRQIHECCPPWI